MLLQPTLLRALRQAVGRKPSSQPSHCSSSSGSGPRRGGSRSGIHKRRRRRIGEKMLRVKSLQGRIAISQRKAAVQRTVMQVAAAATGAVTVDQTMVQGGGGSPQQGLRGRGGDKNTHVQGNLSCLWLKNHTLCKQLHTHPAPHVRPSRNAPPGAMSPRTSTYCVAIVPQETLLELSGSSDAIGC